MTQKQETGKAGEQEAVDYLVKKGHRIIERNYRKKWGELDIVAKAPDRTLVFVEVKALRNGLTPMSSSVSMPEENLTHAKLHKLQRTASLYANSHPDLVDDNRGWRIDLVAIEWRGEEKPEIRHYENI